MDRTARLARKMVADMTPEQMDEVLEGMAETAKMLGGVLPGYEGGRHSGELRAEVELAWDGIKKAVAAAKAAGDRQVVVELAPVVASLTRLRHDLKVEWQRTWQEDERKLKSYESLERLTKEVMEDIRGVASSLRKYDWRS